MRLLVLIFLLKDFAGWTCKLCSILDERWQIRSFHMYNQQNNWKNDSGGDHCRLNLIFRMAYCRSAGFLKPGFHYVANATTTTQKQSDYKAEQSSFTLIALFWLEISRCHSRIWLNGNEALSVFFTRQWDTELNRILRPFLTTDINSLLTNYNHFRQKILIILDKNLQEIICFGRPLSLVSIKPITATTNSELKQND